MKLTSLHELFIHLLQDSLSAEQQLVDALPKLARGSKSPELKKALEKHLAETQEHAETVEELLASFNSKPSRTSCAAMAGIIKEGKEFLDADAKGEVRTAREELHAPKWIWHLIDLDKEFEHESSSERSTRPRRGSG